MYIYQQPNWPNFTWDNEALFSLLGEVRNMQGRLMGKMESLGFDLKNEAVLETLTLDVLKSTEIEGEFLNMDQVRSSIARRLGMDIYNMVRSDKTADGIVELMLDATQHYTQALTATRLFGWHASLFPTGHSGNYKIKVANWRDDSSGPMQVISGAMGKEKVHFQAVDSSLVEREMATFLHWFNTEERLDPVIKAGLAHLWFITIHPFDDGNGRVARAITDMLLARSDGSSQRFYSMSAQIRLQRKEYYEILEKTQKGKLDVTNWLNWFLLCLKNALLKTDEDLKKVLRKSRFWKVHGYTILNARQRLMMNKLLDGFDGKLTSSKWAKIAKCSTDTALRDIHDLIDKKVLAKEPGGGRSTSYNVVVEE